MCVMCVCVYAVVPRSGSERSTCGVVVSLGLLTGRRRSSGRKRVFLQGVVAGGW